jgi:archaellum component FlaG (FlaF/FlaG flagellin family)
MSGPQRSPLASLVLFMCCLAIAASLFAAAHYLVIDLPAQKNLPAPENAESSKSNCDVCKHNCKIDKDYFFCLSLCQELECSEKV